ncbi:MAG: carboxypeptidase-like regulatory domain-containing protein [Armatimonadota bacterium]|nr:carboxypeptidase-like regulatory domain-containing protein [Armatimonadota bacterium]
MDFARVRLTKAALWALSGLALAALLMNGCAAPKSSEQARFGLVQGRVVDTSGSPVAGAEVYVVPRAHAGSIGTQNFPGREGPYITNQRGEFVIHGARVTPGDPVVLNLQARRAGYVPGFAVATYHDSFTVAGREFPAGSRSTDIVVRSETVTGVVATLSLVGASRPVSPSGGTVSFPVPDAANPASILGTGAVTFFPGSLTSTTTVSATALVSSVLPGPPPVVPAGAFTDTVAGAGKKVRVANLVAVVDVQPSGVDFGPNPAVWPEIELPLPMSRSFYGSTVPVLYFNSSAGRWESQPTAVARTAGSQLVVDGLAAVVAGSDGAAKAVFRVRHFSAWAVSFYASFSFGTLQERALSASDPKDAGILAAIDPTSGATNPAYPYFRAAGDAGNVVRVKATEDGALNQAFVQSVAWGTPTFNFTPQDQTLAELQADTQRAATNAFASLFLLDATNPANGPLIFATLQPQVLARYQFSMSAVLESGGQQATLSGQRVLWTNTPGIGPTISVPSIPQHLQGHFQGGGVVAGGFTAP